MAGIRDLWSLGLLPVAIIAIGCDPSGATGLRNDTESDVLVGVFIDAAGDAVRDVVVTPAGKTLRITLSGGVGSTGILERVVIMDDACRVLADQTLSQDWQDGGLVAVRSDGTVAFDPNGRAEPEAVAESIPDCLATLPD